MDLLATQAELRKMHSYPYRWGRKQSDDWDAFTNFIYSEPSFDAVLLKIDSSFASLRPDQRDGLKNYALNRWYNFWSAQGIEEIFKTHSLVQPEQNKYNKLVDFKIDGIPFDHKTSVCPKNFDLPFEQAYSQEEKLIKWLYEQQSQQGRMHLKNRLFVVVYSRNSDEHWRLKSELIDLQGAISSYLNSFTRDSLHTIKFAGGTEALSDVLWYVR